MLPFLWIYGFIIYAHIILIILLFSYSVIQFAVCFVVEG